MTERRGIVARFRQKMAEKSEIKAWIRENDLRRDTENKKKFWIDDDHHIVVNVKDPVAREKATEKILEFRHDLSVGSRLDDEDRDERMAERRARRLRMEKKSRADEPEVPAETPQTARAAKVVDRLAGTPKKGTNGAAVADRLLGTPAAKTASRAKVTK
jgi:hypothetical protein